MTTLVAGTLLVYAAAFAAAGAVMALRRVAWPVTAVTASVPLLLVTAVAVWGASPGAGTRVLSAVYLVLPVLLLLLPDGRPSDQIGWGITVLVVAIGVLTVVYPDPFAVTGAGGLAQALLVIAGMWWRYESVGPEGDGVRTGLLWVSVVGGLSLLVGLLLQFVADNERGRIAASVCLLGIPAGVLLAVVRPRGLDVRSVLSRVVVEASALTVVIALFVAAASLVEVAIGDRPQIGATALLAAGCALALQPARTMLRGVVDRLLFGDREDAVRAASHVGERLADDPVLALRALREALGLPYAALRLGDREVARSGTSTTDVHHHDLVVGGRSVGRLDVGLRTGQVRLRPEDHTVLQVVGPALAQAMHARALTEQLQDQRADVISAVEDERRRLRHDLHDGLGPTLTGIAFAADAARNTVATDPDRAAALVAGLRADATGAIAEVRRLVEGLRPPAVDELGLVGALRQQVRQLHGAGGQPLVVRLEAPDTEPELPAAVEVAAYRIVTEALTNVARHAGCDEAVVRIESHGDRLEVEVRDSGSVANWSPGVGLTSMRDRAEQLGGTFDAHGGPDGGVVRAVLPVG